MGISCGFHGTSAWSCGVECDGRELFHGNAMMHSSNENQAWLLLRSLFFWGIFFAVTLTLLVVVTLFFVPLRYHTGINRTALLWGKILAFASRVKIDIVGEERLIRDGPVIWMANHQSLFDIVILLKTLDRPFLFLAKKSLFRIPMFGWAMWAGGHIPVDRDNRKKALHSLYVAAESVNQGSPVIIFPEGTRGNPDGSLRPFKSGGMILAKKSSAPIQPITLQGARKIIPFEKGRWIQRIHSGRVQVNIHPPIENATIESSSVGDLTELVRKEIVKPLRKSLSTGEKDDSEIG